MDLDDCPNHQSMLWRAEAASKRDLALADSGSESHLSTGCRVTSQYRMPSHISVPDPSHISVPDPSHISVPDAESHLSTGSESHLSTGSESHLGADSLHRILRKTECSGLTKMPGLTRIRAHLAPSDCRGLTRPDQGAGSDSDQGSPRSKRLPRTDSARPRCRV